MEAEEPWEMGRPRTIHHVSNIEWTVSGWGPTASKFNHGWAVLSIASGVSTSGEALNLADWLAESTIGLTPLHPTYIHLTSLTSWILPGLPALPFRVLLSMHANHRAKTGNEANCIVYTMLQGTWYTNGTIYEFLVWKESVVMNGGGSDVTNHRVGTSRLYT